MNIEVLSIPSEKPKHDSYDLVIVVDTLRASTVIAKALYNGAMGVYPASTIEKALKLRKLIPSVVLAGERKSFKIEGFDLGNSPLEFTKENVEARNVVLTTSNGTKTIEKFKGYGKLASMAISNVKATANYSNSKNFQNVLVVCSGSHGEIAMEDFYTAGKYVSMFEMPALNDGAMMALSISKEAPLKILKTSHHGRYLSEHGMVQDLVESCVKIDVVPILKKGPIGLIFFGR